MVTGTGELVTASEDEHQDLLWALRGGGGGFGLVARFRYRLRPFDPTVVGGPLVRTLEEAEETVAPFRACAADSPEELALLLKLCAAPPAPFLPESLHGEPVAMTIACHGGEAERAREDLAVLRAAPEPVADLIQPRRFRAPYLCVGPGAADGSRRRKGRVQGVLRRWVRRSGRKGDSPSIKRISLSVSG